MFQITIHSFIHSLIGRLDFWKVNAGVIWMEPSRIYAYLVSPNFAMSKHKGLYSLNTSGKGRGLGLIFPAHRPRFAGSLLGK